MTDKQNEKLNMHQTVLQYFYEHTDAYTEVPAFVSNVKEFEKLVAAVKNTAEQQKGVAVKGATVLKTDTEEGMVQICLMVAGALFVLATDSKNAELREIASVSKYSFVNISGNQSILLAKNIAEKAAQYSAELVDYGVNGDDLQTLHTAIAAFEAKIILPRSSINKRKQHTGNLSQLIAEADKLLDEKLDKLAIGFKIKNPEFYKGYENARNINNSYVRYRNKGDKGNDKPASEKE